MSNAVIDRWSENERSAAYAELRAAHAYKDDCIAAADASMRRQLGSRRGG
jgi:hypothetical protein